MLAGTLVCALAALLSLAQTAPADPAPPLPDVHLEAFDPAARQDLAPALAEARAHADDPDRVERLARRLHAWEQWDSAATAYARACALEPRFDCYYLGGLVAQRQARQADAASLLSRAVAIQPASLPGRLHLADALLEAGRLDESARLFTTLTGEPAAEPHARYGLGRIAAARGDDQAARDEFSRATDLFPAFGAAWYGLGMADRRLGRAAAARDALEKAARFGSEWPGVPDPLLDQVNGVRDDARAHLSRGIALGRSGDLEGAIREHEAALARDPSLVQAHVNLISLCARAGRWADVDAHFRAAIASGTALADANYNFGVAELDRGQADRAADAFHAALDANPRHAGAWNNLGQLAEQAGRLEEATKDYRQASASAPANPTARFNLARMLLARGELDAAVVELEQLTADDHPDQPRYLFGLATAWIRKGDVPRGRQYAEQAHALAVARGQSEIAAAIERNLARLPR